MDVYACDHTKELIIKAHNNDKSAREKLVIDNSGLVWSIVKRFTGRGAEMEDLYQIGCIGLIKAIDNFNMDYDVKFSTYAVPMITGEIKRFLRDDGIIKISRSIKENGYKCFTASQKLKGILNREPTIEELSRETGIATEDIIVTMEAGDCVESIYKTIYQKDGNEVCLIDKLEGKDGGSDSIIDNMIRRSAKHPITGILSASNQIGSIFRNAAHIPQLNRILQIPVLTGTVAMCNTNGDVISCSGF